MLPLLVALFVGSGVGMALAQGFPNLDVAPSCKASANSDPKRMASCLRDEDGARKALAGVWSQFPAAAQSECTSDTKNRAAWRATWNC